MKNLLQAASVLLLAGLATAQNGAMNSMSASTSQNQMLTGVTAHSVPPAPVFTGGVPDAGDRVSGTPANVTTMHLESESMTAGKIHLPQAAGPWRSRLFLRVPIRVQCAHPSGLSIRRSGRPRGRPDLRKPA
jgi:hypothetical protein